MKLDARQGTWSEATQTMLGNCVMTALYLPAVNCLKCCLTLARFLKDLHAAVFGPDISGASHATSVICYPKIAQTPQLKDLVPILISNYSK